ncbi:hypothetical protein PIIN_11259 [Serendipita indica DSM 11827]|uniref:Uncharacterized protein n=1 Tax=Serendipita indica (strain DSM 11827) TaxID=1109443 RepID=G4U138_SERID|nr:hypothetical protein PIIN_11259 [Serendipita indica DSM 11827]
MNDKEATARLLYDLPGPPRHFLLGSAAYFPNIRGLRPLANGGKNMARPYSFPLQQYPQ